jgi:hypothetical protein
MILQQFFEKCEKKKRRIRWLRDSKISSTTQPGQTGTKSIRLVREITNYKSQITNKPQSQNYKLQIKKKKVTGKLRRIEAPRAILNFPGPGNGFKYLNKC